MLVELTAESSGCEARIVASTDRYISVSTSRIRVLSSSIVSDKCAFHRYIGQFLNLKGVN